jgi:hypothetical protein
MSKYTYESVISTANIDVNNEAMTSAAKMKPLTFAESRLTEKNPEQQANILYSAIRDSGGDINHPIVKAISSYMEKAGISPETIQDVLKEGIKDHAIENEHSSAQSKKTQKQPDLVLQSERLTTKDYAGYKYVEVIAESNPSKKELEGLAKTNPDNFARRITSGKDSDTQTDMLYSALRDGNKEIATALEGYLIKTKVLTRETVEAIKDAAVEATSLQRTVLTDSLEEPLLQENAILSRREDQPDKQYAYKQVVSPKNIESLTQASEDDSVKFAASMLNDKTTKQQADILYSVARDLGKEDIDNHPIVTALKQHMERRGVNQEDIEDILISGQADYLSSLPKQKEQPSYIRASGPNTPQILQNRKDATENPELFASLLLGEKSGDEQISTLYKTVRDLGGDKEDPIVIALKNHMEKNLKTNGLDQERIDGAISSGSAVGSIDIPPPTIGKEGYKHNYAPIISEDTPFKTELRQEYAKRNPDTFAKEILSDKTKKEQADILYSAGVEGNKEITTAIEKDLATKGFTTEELSGIKAAAELERVKKTTIIQREEQEIGEIPKTRPRSKALTGQDDPRAPEKLAQDSVIFGGETVVGPKTLASSGVGSSEVDPITAAIRKEILAEQQKLLKEQIAVSDPSVKAMTPEKFREYLVSEKGKEEAAKVFAKPEMQTALNKIEVDGYKEVHNKFRENFQNVPWSPDASGPDQPKTKSCDIRNDAKEVVATIKETTHDKAPIAVTLDNGKSVQVNSYRTIEFPVDNKGKGPLHLSMAVKDENGKNIAEKDAVYFTAHYDDNGKLTEVSSPVPVKFMVTGNKEIDDNAVGYIERNGKIYTLPVTKKNYDEMMKEVRKNKGMGVDLSQEVDKPSQDLAITKTKTVEPVLEKEKVELAPKAKEQSIDAINLPKQETVPIPIVLKSGLTGAEKTQQIDTALKGATPDQIVATLKDQVAKGGSEVVGLIVEATKPGRVGDHTGVPQLTAEQFKQVYDEGMKGAKAIGEAPPKSTALNMTENLKLNGIQRACGKLAPAANIDPTVHSRTTGDNVKSFATKSKQHSI